MLNTKELLEYLKDIEPKNYQPLYGHEEININAGRPCQDRLQEIKKIYDVLSKELKRPLRVLDLGCNLGYFSLQIAKWGGVVTGIDSHAPNIKVCQILAAENPEYRVEFFCDSIEEIIPLIGDGEYDLVLGFSVLHYICIQHGLEYAKNLLSNLADKVKAGIFELALKSEAVFQHALPENYRDLIAGFDYIKLLSHNRWNNVDRPICFASKKYIYLDKPGLMKIDRVAYHPHYHLNGSKYFYCGDKFIKYLTNNSLSFPRAIGALNFLKDKRGENGLPKLYYYYCDKEGNFINYIFVMDKIDGVNLGEKLSGYTTKERWGILRQIWQWLIFLEQSGYYSFDTQTSNFIVKENGEITLVDYDHILKKDELENFVDWSPFPRDYIMQALWLINEIFNAGENLYNGFDRSPRLLVSLKKHIPLKKYNQLVALQDSEDIFSRMYKILFTDDDDNEVGSYTLAERELLAVEDYLDSVGSELGMYRESLNSIENNLGYLNQKIYESDEKFKMIVDYLGEVQKEFSILNAKLEVLAKENQKKDEMLKEFEKVINSLLATKGD